MAVDIEHFSKITEDDGEFAMELLTAFIEDTHVRLSHIRHAIAEQDAIALRKSAHHLRGSSANVGVPALHTIAKSMEMEEHSWTELSAMLAQMSELLTAVVQFSEKFSEKLRLGR